MRRRPTEDSERNKEPGITKSTKIPKLQRVGIQNGSKSTELKGIGIMLLNESVKKLRSK